MQGFQLYICQKLGKSLKAIEWVNNVWMFWDEVHPFLPEGLTYNEYKVKGFDFWLSLDNSKKRFVRSFKKCFWFAAWQL